MRISDWSSDVCSSDLLANDQITAAVYTAPDATVDTTLPVTTVDGVSSTDPLIVPAVLESPSASVEIPAGTVISGEGWDGTITAPNVAIVTADAVEVPRSDEHTSELQPLIRISY